MNPTISARQQRALAALQVALARASAEMGEGGWSALDHVTGQLRDPGSINDVIDGLGDTIGSLPAQGFLVNARGTGVMQGGDGR